MPYHDHMLQDAPFTLLAGGSHRCDPTWNKPADGMDQCYKLYCPLDGQARLKLETQEVVLRPHHIYIIPGYRLVRQECLRRMDVYWVHFAPKSLQMTTPLLRMEKVRRWDQDLLAYWRPTWEDIPRLFEKGRQGPFYRMQAMLLDLVGQILEDGDVGSGLTVDPVFEQLRPAIAFMDRRLTDNPSPSLADIAKTVHLAPNYFHRKFTAAFHVTPFNYMLNRRLDLGRQLLLNTDLTLRQIASRCGFYNEFHFSKMFKKHYSRSPKQFRRQALP